MPLRPAWNCWTTMVLSLPAGAPWWWGAVWSSEGRSDKKNKEDRWVENLSLSDAMKRLNKREKHIIDLRFFEGKTQMEVAKEIHISQAQVSRLEKSALKTMRNYLMTT